MPYSEVKILSGRMNLDDPLEVMPKGDHGPCRNMWFRGNQGNMRGENIPGNILLVNSFMTADSNNLTIGRYYDAVNKRIFFFNFRNGGNNAIYIFNTISETFQRLVEENVNAVSGALSFTTTRIINNINIIYGDSEQGDILCFTDSLGVPKKINVDRALAGGYGTITASDMDVAKEPADIPPYVVYEDDPSNTVNNLRKKLFKFKIRWVFDDLDKSVTSSQGELPVPYAAFDQTIDTDPTKNCRIAIVYQTGASNVKKIELLAAVSLGNVFSDFFLIQSIDKSVSGIPDNDVATFLFYNNQAYNYINVEESIQLFDYVPRFAGAQALLNGNVLAYGNITEGYPNLTNFTFSGNTSNISSGQILYYSGLYWTKLIANQDGRSGFGSGNIHIVIRGSVFAPSFTLDTYFVYLTDGSNISYTASIGDDASAVINGLRSDAISKGYTIISVGSNDLYVFKASMSLARTFISSNYVVNSLNNTSFMAYDWSSRHGFGLVYFDKKGRTNGVVYTSGFSVTSIAFTEADPTNPYIAKYVATIYHQPPDWATYFQWVRTKNLSKSKIQEWVSDRTFKDTTSAGVVKFAYISIESLNAFVTANPGSPLGYGFSPGDRIKFMKRYNSDTTTANLYGDSKDFEIVSSPVNPTINGEVKTGQFVKIVLPSVDGSFDFGSGFENYFIELYTPAQSVANGLDVYYEYGERYAIGNPTASDRFHQGMLQNQSSDYSTPATFEFFKGDYYARLRAVQTGNVFTFNIPAMTISGASNILMGINYVSQTFSDSNITTHNVSYVGQPVFNPSTDGRWFLGANLVTDFRIQGTITFSFGTDQVGSTWKIILVNKFGENKILVPSTNVATAGTYSFTVDTVTTLEDDHVFLFAQSNAVRTINFVSSNLTFTIDRVISQRMIDQNFSDYFSSAVNSNGRAFVFNENANQTTFPVMYRWSLAYQSDTNINQSNRFFPQNFDSADRGWGVIMAFKEWNRILTFFQERKCGQTGIYQKYITDSGGKSQLLTTNDIITSNNIQYYEGNYGVSSQYDSIVQSGYVYYFYDPILRKILRLSRDGIIDLTLLYKVQTWASETIPNYLNPSTYIYGGNQRITGTYNNRSDNTGELILVAQGSVSGDIVTPGESIAFDESRNSFTDLRDYAPDCILCAENTLYMWQNGYMWKEDKNTFYSFFFGVQKTPSISLPFIDKEVIKKIYNGLAYQSNKTWAAPTLGDVETNAINSQTLLKQQSLIMEQDFDVLENPSRYASFNRDVNSMADPAIALWEGDYLRGNTILVKLSYSGNQRTYMYAPYIVWESDPRNL